MKRISLFIAVSFLLNVFTPLTSSSAAEKYELLDTTRSKCNTGKSDSASQWDKCLDGVETPSVKFEITSKQITPGAPLKLRLYFNFNVQPLDGWFQTSANRIDALWYQQKGPDISDQSRLGNLAKSYLNLYCPNTNFDI